MSRKEAERIITEVLYGAPGASYDTPEGRDMIHELVDRMGLSALTDDAVIRLAAMHRAHDEQQTQQTEALRRRVSV